jgi:hypothetical protein
LGVASRVLNMKCVVHLGRCFVLIVHEGLSW